MAHTHNPSTHEVKVGGSGVFLSLGYIGRPVSKGKTQKTTKAFLECQATSPAPACDAVSKHQRLDIPFSCNGQKALYWACECHVYWSSERTSSKSPSLTLPGHRPWARASVLPCGKWGSRALTAVRGLNKIPSIIFNQHQADGFEHLTF